MFDFPVFFKRNKRLMWLGVAVFVVAFVSIQVSKAIFMSDSNYGEIADCVYIHEAPELQTPLKHEKSLNEYCESNG